MIVVDGTYRVSASLLSFRMWDHNDSWPSHHQRLGPIIALNLTPHYLFALKNTNPERYNALYGEGTSTGYTRYTQIEANAVRDDYNTGHTWQNYLHHITDTYVKHANPQYPSRNHPIEVHVYATQDKLRADRFQEMEIEDGAHRGAYELAVHGPDHEVNIIVRRITVLDDTHLRPEKVAAWPHPSS